MASAEDVRESWDKIEQYLSENVPPLAAKLRPPATQSEIDRALAATGIGAFPREFLYSLAIHDGQNTGFEVFGKWELLSLRAIVDVWQMLAQLVTEGTLSTVDSTHMIAHGPVRPRDWDRAWIPVADDGQRGFIALDLNPAEGGQIGQIVSHTMDGSHVRVVAPDFAAWLEQIAELFASGEYEVSRAGNSLRRRRKP